RPREKRRGRQQPPTPSNVTRGESSETCPSLHRQTFGSGPWGPDLLDDFRQALDGLELHARAAVGPSRGTGQDLVAGEGNEQTVGDAGLRRVAEPHLRVGAVRVAVVEAVGV